ncbi:uncharacterized protein OGAPODRAFT_95460 [Ogataea polymorpha]|uniref:uncharacterized protein n=1 Tax=Ogataea polymorpha TaxID=460523 RepID=UPI0007F4704C|nr:uncharacterized protein OGAPODRAFT_95460 [Ogataea polymorpha]OBA14426.1 hypothetical protein OGAPODRAFT_95460 [Ogataea polymorpha]
MSSNQSPSKFDDATQMTKAPLSPSEYDKIGSARENLANSHVRSLGLDDSNILRTPIHVNSLSKVELNTIISGTQNEDASSTFTNTVSNPIPLWYSQPNSQKANDSYNVASDCRWNNPTLSLEASFGNSNVALPEAIIRKQGDFDDDSNEGNFASSSVNRPVLEDIDNFDIGGVYDAFSSDDSDDNDSLGGEIQDTTDLSLLNVRPQNKVPPFVTIRKRTKDLQTGSRKRPIISLAMIRNITRWLLKENYLKKLQSKEALIELQHISEEFFRQELSDLESYIEHSNRRTVSYVDIKLLLHRARLDPSYDLFTFTDRATSIENDILNLSSQVFDLEITSEIEKLLYRDKIQRSKRIKRQLFKEEEIKRRLEQDIQNESVGSSDSNSDLGEQEHMEKIERPILRSPSLNKGRSAARSTLQDEFEIDIANESQFDSHLYLRIEDNGTSSDSSLVIPLEEEDSEEEE